MMTALSVWVALSFPASLAVIACCMRSGRGDQ